MYAFDLDTKSGGAEAKANIPKEHDSEKADAFYFLETHPIRLVGQ